MMAADIFCRKAPQETSSEETNPTQSSWSKNTTNVQEQLWAREKIGAFIQ